MIRLSSKRIHQLLALAVCLALLLTGFLSIYTVNNVRVQAANTVTIYFDTSCAGKGSGYGWSKSMSKVYYHAYKGSTSTGLKEMTATGKDGKDGGKLFSVSVDTSKYSSIIFSSKSSWSSGTDKLTQTKSYSLSGLADKSIFILNTYGYNEGSSAVQGMYVCGTYKEEETTDYAKGTFSILNMTDHDAGFKLRYTDEVKSDGEWSGNITISSDVVSITIPARNYYYNYFSVPSSGVEGKPYSAVEIQNASGTVLNKYYFDEGKIIGRTYEYGVSELSDRVISYQHANPINTYAINNVLYLDKKSITNSGAVVKGVSTVSVNKDGNALYMTSADVNNGAFTAPSGTASQMIDLSAYIFTMTYGGNKYNMFGPENSGDNLIIINDNVATVSGKYSAQSTDNVLKENGKEYPYVTAETDMFDYQYDKFNSGYYNSDQFKPEGWNSGNWPKSDDGNAKRPYMAINEALSASAYAQSKSNYPMYLGQFWLPVDGNMGFGSSSVMYTDATASKQRSAHNLDGDMYTFTKDPSDPDDHNQTSGYYRYFGFGKILKNFDWSANLAFRYSNQDPGTYEPYNGVVQGLVYNRLVDDKLMANDGKNTIPFFDIDWWKDPSRQNFAVSQNKGNGSGKETVNLSDYIKSYSGLDFPFFATNYDKIKFKNYTHNGKLISNTDKDRYYYGTYYVYNSEINAVKVNGSGSGATLEKHYNDDNYKVWDNYGEGTDGNGSEIGFFPFNSKNDGGHNSKQLHYGFGVRFSIDFYLTKNGTLDDKLYDPNDKSKAIPITFTFQGDDDVWVFLDDKLLLDMGGGHKNSIGEINFADKSVFIGSAGDAGDSIAVSSAKPKKSVSFADLGITEEDLTTGKHKITMFYMERGMLNSNLYVMFNLPMSLTTLELQEDTDFSAVNEGFMKSVMTVADRDVFNYYVENKGTTNVVGSDYVVPSTESVTRSNGDLDGSMTNPLGGGTGNAHTNDFSTSNPDVYSPFGKNDGSTGASYQLTDMFANGKVNYDTRSINGGKSGVISMQYGELATISKQFNYGSSVRVTQLDDISYPNKRSSVTGYNDSTGRKVSDYYNTYTKSTSNDENSERRLYAGIYNGDDLGSTAMNHVEDMYGKDGEIKKTNPNYSMNSVVNLQENVTDKGVETTYNFNDPTNAANEYVHLRQVIVNEVKTYSLTFRKMLENGDPPGDEIFDFQIAFSNVFGADRDGSDAAVEYDKISYLKYVYNAQTGEWAEPTKPLKLTGGTFSLKAYDYIVISGIPAGTNYEVTELSDSSDKYILDRETSMNLDGKLLNNIDAIAYNKIKTGDVAITKFVDRESDEDEFPISFWLTEIPRGLDLTKYTITYSVSGDEGETESGIIIDTELNDLANGDVFVRNLKHDQTLTISGLPYGCKYDVKEDLSGLCYYNDPIEFEDENKVIDDQIVGGTADEPEYADPPIDCVQVTNRPVVLEVEKEVIIDQDEVNSDIYSKIDDEKVQALEFDLSIAAVYDSLDGVGQDEIVPQTDKSYYNMNGDYSTDDNGCFTIKNDYDINDNQKEDAPEIAIFSKQFEKDTTLRIVEDEDEVFTPSYFYRSNIGDSQVGFRPAREASFRVTGADNYLVKNTLNTAPLTLTKLLSEAAEEDLTFTFDVTFTDVAGKYDLTAGKSVTITKSVTLKKGSKSADLTFEGIPVNTKYTVVEKNIPEGYYMLADNSVLSGTVTQNGGTASVTNKKKEMIEMPETGAPFIFHPFVIGISAITLAAAALIIYKRKLRTAALYTDEKGRYKD